MRRKPVWINSRLMYDVKILLMKDKVFMAKF